MSAVGGLQVGVAAINEGSSVSSKLIESLKLMCFFCYISLLLYLEILSLT